MPRDIEPAASRRERGISEYPTECMQFSVQRESSHWPFRRYPDAVAAARDWKKAGALTHIRATDVGWRVYWTRWKAIPLTMPKAHWFKEAYTDE